MTHNIHEDLTEKNKPCAHTEIDCCLDLTGFDFSVCRKCGKVIEENDK